MTIELSCGFTCVIPDERIDNWELIELTDSLVKSNTATMPSYLSFLLGDDQYKELKNYVKKENPVLTISTFMPIVYELMEKVGGKNL